MKKIICALLLLLAVNSWGSCTIHSGVYPCSNGPSSCECGDNNYPCPLGYTCTDTYAYPVSSGFAGCGSVTAICYKSAYGGGSKDLRCVNAITCTTKCERDSVANYASCIAQGNRWENCQCVQNTSADSVGYICNDYSNGGRYTYKIFKITSHYENGQVTTACGQQPSAVSGSGYTRYCPVVQSGDGTCQQAGYKDKPQKECETPECQDDDPPYPRAKCYAVVGSKCYMRDTYSGNTYSCECDGNCQHAYNQMLQGQGCHDPYPPPPTSSSSGSEGGGSSGSGGGSSGSGGNSSGSDGGSSSSGSGDNSSGSSGGGSSGIYTEQLNQIIANTQGIFNNTSDISQWTQTTMNNTTDIKNNLSDIGIDVSHIRSHAQGIESNTGSIDSKLSTTNNLLQSLNNKNWSPEINVNPPEVNVNVGGDTTIVNVAGDTIIVNADTAKSGAAILDFLRETFNGLNFGSDYSENDTAGTGDSLSRSLQRLDSVAGVGVPNMRDSIPRAVTGVRGALHVLRDSVNNSPYNDSVAVWQNQLLNNGVLSGGGANDCPEPLRRNFTWNFGSKLGVIQLGSFRYICEDIFGLGITFWGLARMLLRCMVSIACMLWIYRTVVGVEGGNNEED